MTRGFATGRLFAGGVGDVAGGIRRPEDSRSFPHVEVPDVIRPDEIDQAALIVHLNDAHHCTRARIAAWVADPDGPQDESHAHH